MKYLLDTNIISEFVSPNPNDNVIKFILDIDEDDLYLSVITIGEINFGIERLVSSKRKEKLQKWLEEDLLVRFMGKIVDIDVDIMLKWGDINSKLQKLGKTLPIMDALIGATCKAKNFTLITRNEKDFKNIDIALINPF